MAVLKAIMQWRVSPLILLVDVGAVAQAKTRDLLQSVLRRHEEQCIPVSVLLVDAEAIIQGRLNLRYSAVATVTHDLFCVHLLERASQEGRRNDAQVSRSNVSSRRTDWRNGRMNDAMDG